MKNKPTTHGGTSNIFIQQHSSDVIGVLEGFDRLRFRGTLRSLYHGSVMEAYLNSCRVLIKDFGRFAQSWGQQIKTRAQELADQHRRPLEYLTSSHWSKEELARKIAERDGVKEGLIAVFQVVEPCQAYRVAPNPETKKIEMKIGLRKCSHFYFYLEHPRFGFMHLRVQSWFPFSVSLCLNGRHWLGRQLDQAGVAYQKKKNVILRVEDWKRAQSLLDEQTKTDWGEEFKTILNLVHPLHKKICRPLNLEYYWSASDTEYATDVVFKNESSLGALYPRLVQHALSSFSSPDVMRFLGRPVTLEQGKVHGKFQGEIISDSKRRAEGMRVKHSLNGNSIKFYDKAGSVLRVETTIVQPKEFKVFRKAEGKNKRGKSWRILRKGVADMKRRRDISSKANERYLTALASTQGSIPLIQAVQVCCRRKKHEGRAYRALNPLGPEDGRLMELINQGEFTISGFRNRDIRALYFTGRADERETRRRMGWIGRRLRLLRAHGLIRKVQGTHRYQITASGRTIVTALLTARKANVEQLTKIAA